MNENSTAGEDFLEKTDSKSQEEISEAASISNDKAPEGLPEFNLSNLQLYLTKYIEEVATLDVMSKNTLKSPVSLEGDVLMFHIANPLEKDKIEQEKPGLVRYLRTIFSRDKIMIDHHVNVNTGTSRPYTPKEKLDAMIEKNPELAKLRDKLGLDTDY